MHPDRRSALIVAVFGALAAAVAGPWTSMQWPDTGTDTSSTDASFAHRVATAFPTAAAGFVAHGAANGG